MSTSSQALWKKEGMMPECEISLHQTNVTHVSFPGCLPLSVWSQHSDIDEMMMGAFTWR